MGQKLMIFLVIMIVVNSMNVGYQLGKYESKNSKCQQTKELDQ